LITQYTLVYEGYEDAAMDFCCEIVICDSFEPFDLNFGTFGGFIKDYNPVSGAVAFSTF